MKKTTILLLIVLAISMVSCGTSRNYYKKPAKGCPTLQNGDPGGRFRG